jgi:hypothetical protein
MSGRDSPSNKIPIHLLQVSIEHGAAFQLKKVPYCSGDLSLDEQPVGGRVGRDVRWARARAGEGVWREHSVQKGRGQLMGL